jgi:hypothetical protein
MAIDSLCPHYGICQHSISASILKRPLTQVIGQIDRTAAACFALQPYELRLRIKQRGRIGPMTQPQSRIGKAGRKRRRAFRVSAGRKRAHGSASICDERKAQCFPFPLLLKYTHGCFQGLPIEAQCLLILFPGGKLNGLLQSGTHRIQA